MPSNEIPASAPEALPCLYELRFKPHDTTAIHRKAPAPFGGELEAVMRLSEVDTLEEKIYEAAFLPELWPGVLDDLSALADGLGAVAFGVVDAKSNWTSSRVISSAMATFISQGWHTRNIRAHNGFIKRLDAEPRFVTEEDLFNDKEFLKDPIYTEFFIPQGMGWHAGTVVNVLHGDRLIISVEKPFKHGPVSASAVSDLNRVRPHLARAGMVAARLAFERARTAVETLEFLGLPAFSLTARGRIALTNLLWDEATRFWTTRGGDRLVLTDQRAQRLFAQAIDELASPNSVRSIPLVSPTNSELAMLHLLPVRRSARDLFSGSAAIGFISKRSASSPSAVPVLQALFDLTPSEARIALAIAEGHSIEDIAADSHRSVETVRGHLKNVQSKTGCRRQAELSSLLQQLLLPHRLP